MERLDEAINTLTSSGIKTIDGHSLKGIIFLFIFYYRIDMIKRNLFNKGSFVSFIGILLYIFIEYEEACRYKYQL